jgi:hypothetical protein
MSSDFEYQGCFRNNPRLYSDWNPNNLHNNPQRNNICADKAISENKQYYGIENNNGCLTFNQSLFNNRTLLSKISQSQCIHPYQVALYKKKIFNKMN